MTNVATTGVVLVGWIAGEVLILRIPAARTWVEAGYFAVGVLMAVLGLLDSRSAGD